MRSNNIRVSRFAVIDSLDIIHVELSDTLFCSNSIICGVTQLEQPSQRAFTCSKLTIETLEQGVKYVQS